MKVTDRAVTEQVEVVYRATDDHDDYAYQGTYAVPGTLPKAGTKARDAWDAERDTEIAATYARWYADVTAPTPKPTKADHEAALARAQRDKADAEARIAKATAAIAASEAAVFADPAEKLEP